MILAIARRLRDSTAEYLKHEFGGMEPEMIGEFQPLTKPGPSVDDVYACSFRLRYLDFSARDGGRTITVIVIQDGS